MPPIDGLSDAPFLTNEEILELDVCPTHLVVLGGSYIRLEMGQIFRRLGAEVTIVEVGPRITSREDEDISAALTEHLVGEGLRLETGRKLSRVGGAEGATWLELEDGARIEGVTSLVATGRVPTTDTLGLESIGLETARRG